MIKVTELQIGDWVQNPLGWKAQVQSIRYVNTIKDEWEWRVKIGINNETFQELSLNEIAPIPLTPEILEKNGFGFTKSDNTNSVWNGWWIYEGLELATACLDREGNWPCFINIYDSNIKCEYVHQLQHALRLCGIEKEITL